MKLLICITLLIAYCYAQDSDDGEESYVPEDGPMHIVMHKLVTRCVHNNRSAIVKPGAISLNFFDFENKINESFPIETAGVDILNILGLEKTNKFVFIIPGYTRGITAHSMELIEDSFKDMDTYVIILDDSVYTNLFRTKNVATNYEYAVTYANAIGKSLAEAIVILISNGVSPTNIHVIGHSIGAHVGGKAAQYVTVLTGLKIGRLTGLDASGPCYDDLSNHIRKGQAIFVDLYHCNAFELGSSRHYGDACVFVNNGVIQPRCFTSTTSGNSAGAAAALCSHMSCENFFFATIRQRNIFQAYKCESYRKFKKGECNYSEQIPAGYWISNNASGLYYTSTEDNDISQP